MNQIAPIRDYNPSQLALVRRTVAKDCNTDEFNMFVEVCRRVGLDPFRRQIYAFVFNKNNEEKRQLTIVTAIDGYRAVAARNGDYRPDSMPPEIEYDEALKDKDTNPLGIVKAMACAIKGGERICAEAYWDEFAPIEEEVEWVDTGEIWQDSGKPKKTRKGTGKRYLVKDKWRQMPRLMIAKCAEAQALRKGWPEDLSGFYAEEEMDQAMSIDASAEADRAEQEDRLRLTNTKDAVPFLWAAGEPIEFIPAGMVADRIFAHVKAEESLTGLERWRDTNREGLRQFWALQKSDALECKKAIEAKIKVLESA